jgi:hypothetical protein
MSRDECQSLLDHRIHNVTRATWAVLGVGMFGCEVIPNAFLPSTFALVDTANASLANFNPFAKEYETLMIRFSVISYKNCPFFTLNMASFLF